MSTISTGTSLTTAFVVTGDTSGELVIKTGTGAGTTAMTIDAAQNVAFANPVSFSGAVVAPAGTVSAPGITTTGDTNTGVYFPAANEVAVSAGGTVAAGFNSNGLFFRNRIINGDMRIDQRNAGAAVTINSTANTYTIDRWVASGQVADGVFTVQQDTTVPAGFTNSSKITVTTADASLGATQQYLFRQFVEGNNIADWGWGAAGALTVTLSFWVRSSVTGTFGGALNNNGNTRNYPFTYAINSANTWEYKTVTIAGDTTGTWATNTDRGVAVTFSLGTGTSQSATAGAWTGTSNIYSATGATNLMATLNATWYITGVQLETGSVATPFERRPYGTEFFLCQRYYQEVGVSAENNFIYQGYASSGSTYYVPFPLAVQMRAAPTGTVAGTWGSGNVTGAFTVNASANSYRLNINATSAGNFYIQNNGAGSKLTFAIEL